MLLWYYSQPEIHCVPWLYFLSHTTLLVLLGCNCPELSFTLFSMYLSGFHPWALWQNYDFLLSMLTYIKLHIGLILFLVCPLQLVLLFICHLELPFIIELGISLAFSCIKFWILGFIFLDLLPCLCGEHPSVAFWVRVHRGGNILEILYVWDDFLFYPHTWSIVGLNIKV